MHILDTEAKGLVDRMNSLSSSSRQQIVAKTCQFASQNIIGLEPEILNFLITIDSQFSLSDEMIQKLKSMANDADKVYFQLQETGRIDESLNYFSKARLLSAVTKVFENSSLENSADAIYELCKTQDDSSTIIKFIESKIGTNCT